MYQKRFGLHRKPFQSVQADSDFFPSETYREILPAVLNALRSDLGVAVLTGPSGVGKTVTLESFRRELQPDSKTVFVRGGSVRSPEELLYSLHRQLLKTDSTEDRSADNSAVHRWDVLERLQRLTGFWGPLIILLDDVHLVEPAVFAELRTLLEEESSGQKLVRLLIAGPLLLEEVLAEPSMTDFSQKIRAHVFLQPLRANEAVDYLSHHVSTAGGVLNKIFAASAIEKIVQAADGIPRCLNLLADESLMVCDETDQSIVSSDVVMQAFARLQHLPVAWNASINDCDNEDVEDYHSDFNDTTTEMGPSPNTATITGDGVVEIGGPDNTSSGTCFGDSREDCRTIETISPGVVEIGAPANTGPNTSNQSAANNEDESPRSEESVEDNGFAAEFADSNSAAGNRDTEIIESISEMSENVQAADAVEFGFQSESAVGAEDPLPECFTAGNDDSLEIGGGETSFDGGNQPSTESQEVVKESISEQFDAQIETQKIDTVLNDLEHHLVLASGCSGIRSSDSTERTDEDRGSEDATSERGMLADEIRLEGFERWVPAGRWPASFAPRSPVPVDDIPVEPITPEAYHAISVFDRYTWAELGRPVPPQPRGAVIVGEPPHVLSVWPPSLDGIAPSDSIAIAEVDSTIGPETQAVELLPSVPDPQSLSDYVHTEESQPLEAQEAADDELMSLSQISWSDLIDEPLDADLRDDSAGQFNDACGSLPPAGPDDELPTNTTIEEAPECIESGRLASWVESECADSSAGPEADSQSGNEDAAASESTGRPISRADGNCEANTQAEAGSTSQPMMGIEQPDVASLIANAVERFISESSPPDSGTHEQAAVGAAGVLAEHDEDQPTVTVSEDALDADQYAPRLLAEAKQRVISVLAAQPEMRQAAGAETSSCNSRQAENASFAPPQLSIVHHDETVELDGRDDLQASEQDLPKESQSTGFRNLFTRLRKRNKRSA